MFSITYKSPTPPVVKVGLVSTVFGGLANLFYALKHIPEGKEITPFMLDGLAEGMIPAAAGFAILAVARCLPQSASGGKPKIGNFGISSVLPPAAMHQMNWQLAM